MKLTDEQAAAVKAWQGLSDDDRKAFARLVRYARADEDVTAEDAAARDAALALLRALASPAAEPVSAAYKSESLQKTQQLPCATCGETGFMRLSSEPMSIPWPGPDSPAPSCATCGGSGVVSSEHEMRDSAGYPVKQRVTGTCPDCAAVRR